MDGHSNTQPAGLELLNTFTNSLSLLVYLSLQDAKELPVIQCVCKCISSLLDRCHSSSRALTEFSSRQLPAIMTSLQWFTAADPTLQCMVLPLVTKCLVYYPAPCAQFRSQLHKWACVGLFSLSHTFSQECSRLMVLTNGYQWSSLVQTLIIELQVALAHLMYQGQCNWSVLCIAHLHATEKYTLEPFN